MLSRSKPLYYLRVFVTGTLIASFVLLSYLFVRQYIAFEKLSKQIALTSSGTEDRSEALYKLSMKYGEADHLFRLFTTNFNAPTYELYNKKLEEIKHNIDSLSKLPEGYGSLFRNLQNIEEKKATEQEFIVLRQTIADLVFLSQDSLKELQDVDKWYVPRSRQISTDSIVNRILADTAMQKITADTIVQKKQGLFKRIFKAQDNLVVSNSVMQHFNHSQIEALYRNIDHLNMEQQRLSVRRSTLLKNRFRAMIKKEREIIQANYRLLGSLRSSIQNLKEKNAAQIKVIDREDVAIHRASSEEFKLQLVAAIAIMLVMLLLIFFYQSNASRYQKRLRLEKEYAARVAEEKTNILANVGHEVRTPISSLLGVIELLKNENSNQGAAAGHLESIVQEITVINSSINDILNLSKLEAGNLEVKSEYFFPHRLLTETIKLHSYQAKKKDLQLEGSINIPRDMEVLGSAFRIRQITSNLLSNAIKYTDSGTVSLTADIFSSDQQQKLVISIKDSGIGISKEDQRNVFRKYYMTNSEARSSFGLGLYISNLFALQLGGRIAVESVLGKGSIFRLEVPCEKSRQSGDQKQYSLTDLPDGFHITFIDDNRINLMYLKHQFEKTRIRASFFSDPSEAILFIKTKNVDAVVTDMLMPNTNGWSVLSSIKNQNPDISIFLCSADVENIENYRGDCTHHFDGTLSKPLNEHEFVSKLLEVGIFKKKLIKISNTD